MSYHDCSFQPHVTMSLQPADWGWHDYAKMHKGSFSQGCQTDDMPVSPCGFLLRKLWTSRFLQTVDVHKTGDKPCCIFFWSVSVFQLQRIDIFIYFLDSPCAAATPRPTTPHSVSWNVFPALDGRVEMGGCVSRFLLEWGSCWRIGLTLLDFKFIDGFPKGHGKIQPTLMEKLYDLPRYFVWSTSMTLFFSRSNQLWHYWRSWLKVGW